jgi:hypothetical protein
MYGRLDVILQHAIGGNWPLGFGARRYALYY